MDANDIALIYMLPLIYIYIFICINGLGYYCTVLIGLYLFFDC